MVSIHQFPSRRGLDNGWGDPPRTPARWGASGAARQSIREVAPLIRSLVELESRCRVERPRIERPRPLCRRISRERWEILAPDADLAEHCWQAARSPERLESRRELLGGGGDTFFNARGDPTPARHVSRIRARRRPQALVGPYIAGGPACPPHDIARRGGRVCPPHQKMAIAIADMIRVPADDVRQHDRDRDAVGRAVMRGQRSEERRVGKECRSRWSPYH